MLKFRLAAECGSCSPPVAWKRVSEEFQKPVFYLGLNQAHGVSLRPAALAARGRSAQACRLPVMGEHGKGPIFTISHSPCRLWTLQSTMVSLFALRPGRTGVASSSAGRPPTDTIPRTRLREVLFGRQSASRSVTPAGDAPRDARFPRVTSATQTPPSS